VNGRVRIRVRGRVQGVGFRPFVHAEALRLGLRGSVRNDAEGVLIDAAGDAIDALLRALHERPPPLARVDAIEVEPTPDGEVPDAFSIVASRDDGAVRTEIGPDAAVCADCLRELFDPADRRHLHPFITCTHCGPRYTLTAELPYDRPQTAMAGFPFCARCAAEYADPRDRRFHAETTCCPDCGPRLSMPVEGIWKELAAGRIVALKGVGGYHLACDARHEAVVARLRARKQREAKPFAVMVANLASARALGVLDAAAEQLLVSCERPIVVVPLRASARLAPSVSQDLPTLGLMLPYTPIHHLLFHAAAGAPRDPGWLDRPSEIALVMTSANPHGEPLVHTDAEAHARLAGIADVVVDHDRAILVRCDDSVMRVVDGAPAFIRRARGFVPEPIPLGHDAPATLGLGAYLKNTVCLTRGREAFVSQHVGDLDSEAARRFLFESVAHLQRILDVRPERIVLDLHPDAPGAGWALETGVPLQCVQHHHAHVAAVLGEHAVTGPALGLALDGYGYGSDGGAWGGELLRVDAGGCARIGHLSPIALPGGDRAAREPWRCAAAALHALGRGAEIERRFAQESLAAPVRRLLERGDAPTTSSAGRWFDAACGLLGVHPRASYEGQAPMALEGLVRAPRHGVVPPRLDGANLDLRPLLEALLDVPPREGAELFHGGLVDALAAWVVAAARASGIGVVALSGGCLLNRVLAEGLGAALRTAGLHPLLPRRLPPNDGAIAFGQVVAAGL
jgi:hydrogenase maturation protein HypF